MLCTARHAHNALFLPLFNYTYNNVFAVIEHRFRLLSSETNDMNTGLLVEVWCKGFLWDRFMGYYYIPLSEVSYMNEVTTKQPHNTSTTVSTGIQEQHISLDSMRDTNSNTQAPDITNTVH